MQQFKQSETIAARRYFYLHLVDATDGITPETSESGGQPQISTNGSLFANTENTLTAVGNGLYYVALTASELGTLGVVVVRYKSANTAEFQDIAYVRALDIYSTISVDNAAIADAVWDEAKADHTATGSFGKLMQDIYTALGSLSIDLGGVWDADLTLHTAEGTFGAKINNLGDIVFEVS